MKRFVVTVLAVLLALTSLLLFSSVSRAEEITCIGSMGAVTVDNLRVPQNASCTLVETKVEGTIKVENGASLTASQITVIGNIQAEGAAVVNVLAHATVGGSIQIKQGGAAQIDEVQVNGDIQLESNNGALSATRNQVGGNVQVFQNTGDVTIAHNSIDGNLQCKENDPPPTGGNNVVHGNKEDQCADLMGVSTHVVFLSAIWWNGPTSNTDTTPPDTTITDQPVDPSTDDAASFSFTGSNDVTPQSALQFECRLDSVNETDFLACVSPHSYTGLSAGSHTFEARAVDQAGNIDPTPASYEWTISPSADCGPLLTLFADADSWIDQNSSSNNFGTDAILKVRSQGPNDNFRTLVRFPLPTRPSGCVVESATLRLYAASWTADRTLQALRVADDWTESLVTWNTQPQTIGDAATTTSGQGYREWNVASQVQARYGRSAARPAGSKRHWRP